MSFFILLIYLYSIENWHKLNINVHYSLPVQSVYKIKPISNKLQENKQTKESKYVQFISSDSVQGLEFKTQITVIFDYANKTWRGWKTV